MTQRSANLGNWFSKLISLLLIAVLFLALIYTSAGPASGSATAQIIARYVDQFRVGNGLVFNPGDRVLLIAAPLHIILVAVLRTLFDAQTASALLFAIAILISSFTLYRLARRAEL